MRALLGVFTLLLTAVVWLGGVEDTVEASLPNCTEQAMAQRPHWYLNMDNGADPARCPMIWVFRASPSASSDGQYTPQWGYNANIANDYGKVAIDPLGDVCSNSFDSGPHFDFNVPCRGHDYCWDLIRAGMNMANGIFTERDDCDGAFYDLMTAECNDRNIVSRGLCYGTRNTYYAFVQAAPPPVRDPGGVTLNSAYRPTLCADIFYSSTSNGVVPDQFPCTGNANQEVTLVAHPTQRYYFQVRFSHSGKCLTKRWNNSSQPVQQTCDWNLHSQHWQFFSDERVVLRGNARCLAVPTTSAHAADLVLDSCSSSLRQRWLLSP